jgi:hypothetical protein
VTQSRIRLNKSRERQVEIRFGVNSPIHRML